MRRRLAAVDFGSNTLSVLVADVCEDGAAPVVVERRSRYVRLSEGLHTSDRLADAAKERALLWAGWIADRCRELGVDELRAVGTEALRRAEDGAEFLAEVRAKTGIDVEVIDGRQEAAYAYRGVRWSRPESELVIFDIGGASSEVAIGAAGDDGPRWSISLPVGAVSLTEFVGEDLAALRAAVRDAWREPVPEHVAREVVVMGGTARNLVALDLERLDEDELPVEGHRLSSQRMLELGQRALALTPEQRSQQYGIPPRRADVSMAGFAILEVALQRLGLDSVVCTSYSLRHGVLASMRPSADGWR